MNATVPVAPYGKNALLTHAAAVVLGGASALCYAYVSDPSGSVFAVMAGIAGGVIWCWAIFLAVRSVSFENRRRYAWAIIILSLVEFTLPCIPPWIQVFDWYPFPDFVYDSEAYWRFFSLVSTCAFPVFAPFLFFGLGIAIAVSGLITRSDENRWGPRRLQWTAGLFVAMAIAILPWPLFLFCGAMAGNGKNADWNTRIAESMPYLVQDGVAACLYSRKPGALRSIYDKLFEKRLVSRKYVIALAKKILSEFSTNPSQAAADDLGLILSSFRLPKEEGEAVLRALATPQFFSRASYAVGTRAGFSIKLLFTVNFKNAQAYQDTSYHVRLDDGPNLGGSNRGGNLGLTSTPQVVESSEGLLRAGTHRAMVIFSVQIHEQWKGPVTYECRFEHAFDIQAVPRGIEEKPQSVSNRSIDAAMQSAFLIAAGRYASGFSTKSGQRVEVSTTMRLDYSALPENVGFKLIYQDSTGAKFPLNNFQNLLELQVWYLSI